MCVGCVWAVWTAWAVWAVRGCVGLCEVKGVKGWGWGLAMCKRALLCDVCVVSPVFMPLLRQFAHIDTPLSAVSALCT